MKNNLFFQLLTLIFAIWVFCSLPISAQNSTDSEKEKLFPPAEENFVKATGTVLPWSKSGCLRYHPIQFSYCNQPESRKLINRDITDLYNADGSLWYQINHVRTNDNYFGNQKNTGFLPFAVYGNGFNNAILRVVGESPNWYEVEVNVKTGATKFVLKSDPNWAKKDWEYWLAKMYFFELEDKQQKLLDQPDGKVIEELADLNFAHFNFLGKTEGDWTLVQGTIMENRKSITYTKYQGWIRWRKNGNILVNDGYLIITEIQNDAENK